MASNSVKHLYLLFRIYMDKLVDFLFSFICETHQAIPDLKDSHKILAESATSLAKKIRNKELKSEDLVRAFIGRIVAVNPIINAVTDQRYEEALEDAREVDRLIAEGLPDEYFEKKPFLGVPFTAKESHGVRGMVQSLGLWSRRHTRAHQDAECVALVRAAGAIPLAVTNVPEINKWQESRNMLYGQTNNPYHTGRTVGGSSGGEGALMASIATPISICSDIGGSTRMPAFYCGLFGHNPTAGTTSLKGSTLRSGSEDTIASVGFVCRHAEDLSPLTRLVTVTDTARQRLDWNKRIDIKDVKIYYVESADDLRVSPICPELRAAMNKVITGLSSSATSTDGTPTRFRHEGFRHMFSLWKYHMSKEQECFPMMITNNKYYAKWYIELPKKLLGLSQYTLAAIFYLITVQVLPTPDETWAEGLTAKMRDDITTLLGERGVLLFPSAPHPAPYHRTAFLRPFNFAYWAVFNALRLPATQVPLGLSEAGLPLGIQVVAAPYNDALSIAFAQHLERQFGGFVPPCKV